ncbi:MAG: hypothetical protein V1701_05225 [Planctomycetota bacterium]
MKRILIILLVSLFVASNISDLSAAKSTSKPSKKTSPKKDDSAKFIKPSGGYQQVAGVIHLQTPVSGGKRTVNDYVDLARKSNIGVVCITDHDNQRYQYGLWPFRWLIKKTEERASVMTFGIANYLATINQANQSARDVMVIDGEEVTPYYYWTGSYFKDTLTLNNRHKHLLVLGLNQAKYYQDLPTIASGKSRFSQYDAIQTYEPYQDLINYVIKNNGLIYWAHPDSKEHREMGGVKIHTLPYSEALEATVNYTGFAVLGEGYQKTGIPGGIWDKTLMEFCAGRRARPAWAIGELDDIGDKDLGGVQTIFMLRTKSYQGVIEAMRTGKNYVVTRANNNPAMALTDFWIMANNKVAYSGDLIGVSPKNAPTLYVKLASAGQAEEPPPLKDKKGKPVPFSGTNRGKSKGTSASGAGSAFKTMATVKIISNGRLVQEYNQALPVEIKYIPDITNLKPGQMTYYRLDIMDSNQGHLISNPIFVKAE